MTVAAHLVIPDALARTVVAGRPLGDHLRLTLAEADLPEASGPGPLVTLDGLFAAVDAESLRDLASSLPDRPGVLRTEDGRIVATARPDADPGDHPKSLLQHPGGRQIVLASKLAVRAEDAWQLAVAERLVVERVLQRLARSGVRLMHPDSIWVEATVKVEPGAVLWPGVVLRGHTVIGAFAEVGPHAVLVDTVVAARATVKAGVVAEGARIGPGSAVGPMAHLRPGTVLDSDVKVGNFVECKQAHLHDGVRAGHLSYLGDTEIGENANIGAGTITCNYDGTAKHRTDIGAKAFVGSNTALVAPVRVGPGAIVGAGSTVTRDVPGDALFLSRAPDRVYEGKAPSVHARNRRRADGSGHE